MRTKGTIERPGRVPFVDFFFDSTRCGTKIAQGHYSDTGRYPIVDQGDNEIAGFTDCDEGLFKEVPVVIFGDHTRIVKYVDQPFFLGADGVKILTPCKDVFCKFAFYALKAARIESLGYSRHFKLVKELRFPLPPLAEQKRIAEELDNICAAKKDAEAIVEKLKLLAKSRFVEMFGDPVNNTSELPLRKLGDLGIWSSGGTPSRQHPEYFNGTIDWYSAGELNSFELPPSNEKITEDALKNSSAKLWPSGSLLVGMYDTAALKMGTLTKAAASNQACACLIPHEDVNLRWLYAVLSIMRESFLSHRHGCRQKNLSLGMIKGFEIPWAELALQRQYAAFVEQLDKSVFEAQALIGKLDLLYRAKLQEYFG